MPFRALSVLLCICVCVIFVAVRVVSTEDSEHLHASHAAHSEKNQAELRRGWFGTRNVAEGLGLSEVGRFPVRVALNIILVGFQGDGNAAISVTNDVLKPWFEHLDHELPHVFVRNQNVDRSSEYEPRSKVVYDYTYRVLELDPLVNSVFEMSRSRFARITGPGTAVVDMRPFEDVLTSLLNALDISSTYSLIIWNPKLITRDDAENAHYGYMSGLSKIEKQILASNATFQAAIKRVGANRDTDAKDGDFRPERPKMDSRDSFPSDPAGPRTATSEPMHADWKERSREWASLMLKEGVVKTKSSRALGLRSPFELTAHVISGLEEAEQVSTRRRLIADLTRLDEENLPVDVWISSERFVFIDLTAGPFRWGPILGGEGMRTDDSLPSVFSAVSYGSNPQAGGLAEVRDATTASDGPPLPEHISEALVIHYFERFCSEASEVYSPKFCQRLLGRYSFLSSGRTADASDPKAGPGEARLRQPQLQSFLA